MSTSKYDVIVIGGGPSGMMAAGRAAECGKRVLLVEKNRVLGKKLSTTGGGRCNILNAEKDTRKLLEKFGDAAKFLHSPFSQFGMKEAIHFFESRGLPIVVEARKRAFPESQNAEDVTKLMRNYVTSQHVEIRTGVKLQGFIMKDEQIIGIQTNKGEIFGNAFVLSTGGCSHGDTGSTGEGVKFLGDLGHRVHDANPNIVPLVVEENWVKKLSGNTLSFMKITFSDLNESKKTKFSKTGKILFTHFGLSGPLILNAAHEVRALLRNGHVRAYIDLYPDTDLGTVRNRILEVFNINKNKQFKNIISELVPHGMTDGVLEFIEKETQDEKVHSISKEARLALADLIKAMPLTVTGTMGLDWAVISDGGVDLSEIDTKTMRSKKFDNLYLTGDALHINRPSGGYSLQLCWTTGYVAGQNA